MIITGKKVCTFIGWLVLIISTLMVLGNLILDYGFSYIAIGIGIVAGCLVLTICAEKKNS
ncbi:hypothetical protein [Clostridium sp. DL1XJH146]